MPEFKPLHYEHVCSINLPLCEYAGVQWVPCQLLAKELGMTAGGLRSAATHPRAREVVLTATLLDGSRRGQFAIARHSLAFLAQRLRCGERTTNNALLRFVSQAAQIAAIQHADLLASKSQRVSKALERRRLQSIERERLRAAFVEAYDQSVRDGLAAAQKAFTEKTKRPVETMQRFFHGTYPSQAAKLAAAQIVKRDGKFAPPLPRRGRPPRLTPFVIESIKRWTDAGMTAEEIQKKLVGTPIAVATIADIARGFYRTAAARSGAGAAGGGTAPASVEIVTP